MNSVPSARSADDTPSEPGAQPGPGSEAPVDSAAGPAELSPQERAAAGRARAARRALAVALLFGAVGAAFALIAGGQVWSHSTASFARSELPVQAKGSEVTGLPSALGLVGLAALVAVFAVKRAARLLVAALLTLCGAGTLLSALLDSGDPAPLDAKAAKVSGLAQSGIHAVHVTGWPYLSAAGGALLLCAGLLALRYGRGWPSMSGSGRYERTSRRPRTAPEPGDPERPEDLWKALDRGEDPTHGTA